MDCFKIKLLLRNSHHSQRQDYSSNVFEHLFLCRSCWAYANYLWHREAQDVGRKQRLAESDHAARLEKAWAERHQSNREQSPSRSAVLRFGAIPADRKLPH